MASPNSFFITTPIYYVNDVPHLGHVFEVVGIDVQARYQRLIGRNVTFLTGTDEHGQKVAGVAERNSVTPQQWVDTISAEFRRVWDLLKISYDDFVRTTDPRHHEAVARLWRTVRDRGDIYLGKYEGWYDVKEEAFITETEMKEKGLEPDNIRIKRMAEDAYFFRLSKYRQQIIDFIEHNPDFIQPEMRKNEVLKSFLVPDMPDLCVSRTSITWGIPVPDAPGHVIYVWFDALTNYITGAGYGTDESKFLDVWPAELHVIGKDIVKFHCVYWPAMLLAAGLELPKGVFGHGFITVQRPGVSGEEKMSKSAGNAINPLDYIDKLGVEPLRFLLMKELSYGSDGLWNEGGMVSNYNAALPNGIGNLLSRVTSLAEKNFPGGEIRHILDEEMSDVERGFVAQWKETVHVYETSMPKFEYQAALNSIFQFVNLMNLRITELEPWKMAKDPNQAERLRVFLSCCAEGLRGLAELLKPFTPDASVRMLTALGLPDNTPWEKARLWGHTFTTTTLKKGEPLFPKIEV